MPTENRSSNTELISQAASAIEDLLANGTGSIAAGAWASLPAELRALAAKASPQPQSEPIAWMVGTAFWWTKEETERDAEATGLPVTPVGPITESGKPAEQHQGEPVAWLVNGPDHRNAYIQDPMDWAQGYEVVPLYTHADPGEAEDLLASTSLEFGERLDAVEKERDTLRSLLDEIAKRHWSGVDFDLHADLVARISGLSANAEPEATS